MPEKPVDLWAMTDLCTPWCIFTAATFRIAEQIAAGNDRIGPLAAAVQADSYVLHRMLEHLVDRGIFEEPEPGRFALNDPARGMMDPGMRLGLDLNGIGGRMAHAWGTMLAYVRTGKPAYHEVFGRAFWEDLDANPEVGASFDALIGPQGHGAPNPQFDITGGWDTVRTIIDVGGGTGAMLAEVLRTHAALRGTLVDLPRAVAGSAEIFRAAGVADRASAVGQSFFDPLPPGADLYLLRGILNDWPDEETIAILKRCAEAARPDGRVVVLKSVGPAESTRGITIEMILAGGRHRTVAGFTPLAEAAGLEVTAAGKQPAGYFVVECRPAGRATMR